MGGRLFSGFAQFRLIRRPSAECADFDNFSVVVQVHEAEAFPDNQDMTVPEDFLDLFRRCRGGQIVVFRLAVQKKITDRAADDIGFISGFLEPGDDFNDVRGDFGL